MRSFLYLIVTPFDKEGAVATHLPVPCRAPEGPRAPSFERGAANQTSQVHRHECGSRSRSGDNVDSTMNIGRPETIPADNLGWYPCTE